MAHIFALVIIIGPSAWYCCLRTLTVHSPIPTCIISGVVIHRYLHGICQCRQASFKDNVGGFNSGGIQGWCGWLHGTCKQCRESMFKGGLTMLVDWNWGGWSLTWHHSGWWEGLAVSVVVVWIVELALGWPNVSNWQGWLGTYISRQGEGCDLT